MAQLIDDNWNTGRRSCCLTPLPRWVAEGLAAGGNVGGTCVKCGTLVTVGTDPVEGGGCLERTETEVGAAARPVQGCQKGEQWTARGWGRRWWRRRKRGLSRGVAGPCTMIALPNEIFTCSCLYADHTGNSAAVRHAAGDTNCGMNSTGGGPPGGYTRGTGPIVSRRCRAMGAGGRVFWSRYAVSKLPITHLAWAPPTAAGRLPFAFVC